MLSGQRFLTALRAVVLFFSMATLGCHIAQIVLLVKETSFPVSNIPYVLYFVGPGFSTLCSLGLVAASLSSVRSVRGDRLLGVINIALMIAVIVYNTLKSGTIPWTGDKEEATASSYGFATYCSNYPQGSSTFNRCWLVNGTWLGSIVITLLWIVLLFVALFLWRRPNSDSYSDIPSTAFKDAPMENDYNTTGYAIDPHEKNDQRYVAYPQDMNQDSLNHTPYYSEGGTVPLNHTHHYPDGNSSYPFQQQQQQQQQQQHISRNPTGGSNGSGYFVPHQYATSNGSPYRIESPHTHDSPR